jgi:two-component system chemotaxis sensor kinase CheA
VAGPSDELQQIFRDELEDQLGLLARERGVLAAEGADPEARRAAFTEIYRAFHSLKGAARAVGHAGIEQLCDAVESMLSPARGRGVLPAGLAATLLAAEEGLRAASRDLAVGRPPDEGALRRVREAIVRGAASIPAPAREEPKPGPSEGAAKRPAVAAALAEETVRVSPARLGELLTSSEDLLALAGRHGDDASWKALEDLLTELRGELRRARFSLLGDDLARSPVGAEVLRRLDRGLVSVQTAGTLVVERQREEARAWHAQASLASEIAGRARALRVVPFGSLLGIIERTAHEAASTLGKDVDVAVEGGAVEIDRRLRDALREPLLHLLRNAIDHGIEAPAARERAGKPARGKLLVAASLAGRDLQVIVEDDGRGVDLASVRAAAAERGVPDPTAEDAGPGALLPFLCEPGVTTRADVTAHSGRGVGLDVVRQRIAAVHGRVDLSAQEGRGARFTLILPLDLGITRGLVVRAAGASFVLVTTAVMRLARVGPADVRAVEGRLYLHEPTGLVPLADLDVVLGLPRRRPQALPGELAPCVVLAAGDRRAALRVDALLEERDVVVRPLGARLRRTPFVSGATLLGQGEVAPVLDAADLVRFTRPAASEEAADVPRRRRLLVVDDSVTTRQLERTILETAGYEVLVARDGQEAWEILGGEVVDLVISDIEMPRLDGFGLVARLRANPRTARLPVVLVTGLASDADRARAAEVGASAYVVKGGFDQEGLIDTLEQLL